MTYIACEADSLSVTKYFMIFYQYQIVNDNGIVMRQMLALNSTISSMFVYTHLNFNPLPFSFFTEDTEQIMKIKGMPSIWFRVFEYTFQ